MELFGLLFAFLLVLLYKLLNKIVPDDDKNKDKRDDIERWNDHLNYRGYFFQRFTSLANGKCLQGLLLLCTFAAETFILNKSINV